MLHYISKVTLNYPLEIANNLSLYFKRSYNKGETDKTFFGVLDMIYAIYSIKPV